MYTIKQAAARTGVGVPLLRAWERRYGIVRPTRTPSGYRLYDDDAISRLVAMRRLVDDGWAPSAAAAAIVAAEAPAEIQPGRRRGEADAEDAARADAFVRAAGELDGERIEGLLDEMFARGSFEHVAASELMPAVVALGDAWADGRIDVAAEHFASHAVLRRLAAAYEAAGRPPAEAGAVIIGLPPGSHHELGALAFAVAARRAGLPVVYLGPDLPVGDWVATSRRLDARAAVIGVVTQADVTMARQVAIALRAEDPGVIVAFGGRHAPRVKSPDGRLGDADARTITLPDDARDAVELLGRALAAGAR